MRFILSAVLITLSVPAFAATEAAHPHPQDWAFDGVRGTFDKPSIQRGLQVYKEVCATCHSLNRVAFRSLTDVGFSEAEVKSLAAEYTVMDGPNDDGEMFERPGRASDKFPSPYPNEQAARAINNGAYPVDLSLITKARHDGPNYVHALLTGYEKAPAYVCKSVNAEGVCVKFHRISPQDAEAMEATAKDEAVEAAPEPVAADAKDGDAEAATEAAPVEEKKAAQEGDLYYCSDVVKGEEMTENGKTVKVETCTELGKTMHYNPYFPGKQIAMPAPLHVEGQVEYQDEKTKATVTQMSHDLVNFLQWAAEPEMESRKRMGIRVMIFLVAFTAFFYVAKKRIWSRIGH